MGVGLTLEVPSGEVDIAWHRVPCRGKTALFFSCRRRDVTKAKSLCEVCPARLACLEFSLVSDEMWGTWGGVSEKERRELRALAPVRRSELVASA